MLESFLSKVEDLYSKKDSVADVSLWVLRTFSEHLW